MNSSTYAPAVRARIRAARGLKSSTVVALEEGIPSATVRSMWHAALVRGEVEPLATRYSVTDAPHISNRKPGRLRKANARDTFIVEGTPRRSRALRASAEVRP